MSQMQKADGSAAPIDPDDLGSLEDLYIPSKAKALSYYKSLSASVKRRIQALKKVQLDTLKVQSDYFKEINDLERQYATRHDALLIRRQEIVAGRIEPTDSDCDWATDDEEDDAGAGAGAGDKKAAAPAASKPVSSGEQVTASVPSTGSGIPNFWLTIFRNITLLADMVQAADVSILKHLEDIRIKLHSSPTEQKFVLEFHFSPNDFLTDTVLTKEYFLRYELPEKKPLLFEGPEIVRTKGCTIQWKPNKNPTVKIIKKVLKHKNRGEKKVVNKTVKMDSFFNFFDPPLEAIIDELDETTEQLLQRDFEIGGFLRDRVIPRAVLYFTGEALEEDEFGIEGDDDDDLDEEEDD